MSAPLVQRPPSSPPPLVRIPVEILLRITYHLPTVDLCSVRLTCRSLERSLFHFFSHEFFRKKQFMVFSESLQALIDISKHPALSPFLKHVIIATDSIVSSDRRGDPLMPPHTLRARDEVNLALADHKHLLSTGGLKEMLAEAFSNLPNLETIDIRDFNSATRNRDGMGTPWQSYGAASMKRRFGDSGSFHLSSGPSFSNMIFSATVAALAVADCRPQQIHVNIRNTWARDGWSLSDRAFYIPPRLEVSMTPVLEHLTTLHLVLKQIYTSTQGKPFMLQRFLSLTPNLTWLRLNFSSHDRGTSELSESLFHWIITEETDAHPSRSFQTKVIRLSKLKQLDLGSVEIPERTLLQLVGKLASSLETLSLRRVVLADPNVATNPWNHFFKKLATLGGIGIREMNLGFLQNFKPNVVDFGTQTVHGASRPIMEISLRDTSTAELVKRILPRMHIPAIIVSDSEESDESDSDMDSDEDMEDDEDDE